MKNILTLFNYLPHKRKMELVALIILMIIGAFVEVLSIAILKPFFDTIKDPATIMGYKEIVYFLKSFNVVESEYPLYITMFTIFLILFAFVVRLVVLHYNFYYIFKLASDLGTMVFKKVITQPYEYHISHNSSEFIAGIRKVDLVVDGVIKPLMQSFVSSITAISIFILLLNISLKATVFFVFAVSLLYIIITLIVKVKLRDNSYTISKNESKRVKIMQEGFGAIRDIIIDNSHNIYIENFNTSNNRLRYSQAKIGILSQFPRIIIEVISTISFLVLLYIISSTDLTAISLSVLGVFAFAGLRILPSFQQIYYGWASINGNLAVLNDLLKILSLSTDNYDKDNIHSLLKKNSNNIIELKNIYYKYPDTEKNVINNISVTFKKSECIGVVGETGSGKSTLIDCILGLISCTTGEINIFNEKLNTNNLSSWQLNISHVPQKIYLSDGTIWENIAFGVKEDFVDMDKVINVSKQSLLHKFIIELPEGYNTIIGEDGVKLSGGQRQRLGIARALYKKSRVLILDEATSALDTFTEKNIIKNITETFKDSVIIMIAHRISTLNNCNKIIELEEGQIAWQGSYAELLDKNRGDS